MHRFYLLIYKAVARKKWGGGGGGGGTNSCTSGDHACKELVTYKNSHKNTYKRLDSTILKNLVQVCL